MSPLGLLALAFAVVVVGGGAVVFVHDLLEARFGSTVTGAGPRGAGRLRRAAGPLQRKSRGVVFTVTAGSFGTSRGDAAAGGRVTQ